MHQGLSCCCAVTWAVAPAPKSLSTGYFSPSFMAHALQISFPKPLSGTLSQLDPSSLLPQYSALLTTYPLPLHCTTRVKPKWWDMALALTSSMQGQQAQTHLCSLRMGITATGTFSSRKDPNSFSNGESFHYWTDLIQFSTFTKSLLYARCCPRYCRNRK